MPRFLVIALSVTDVAFLSYWTLQGEFEPSWYLPNLALVIWPSFFMGRLCRPE